MDTLVLDTSYIPIQKVTWQRAITLLSLGKVEVLEEYEDREVKSVTFSIKMPSIIRFLNAARKRHKMVKFSRENIYTRDREKCQYCGIKLSRPEMTLDHVIPKSKGGTTTWDNVVICCVKCNQKKRDRTPQQAGMSLLSTPSRPKKLPTHINVTVMWRKGEPESWQQWLSSFKYWNDSLEEG